MKGRQDAMALRDRKLEEEVNLFSSMEDEYYRHIERQADKALQEQEDKFWQEQEDKYLLELEGIFYIGGSKMQIRELSDVMEGFVDNMSDEEIDKNLKFFGKVARHFHQKSYDHIAMVTGEEDFLLSEESAPEGVLALNPVFETLNGNRYAYFKNTDDAEKAVKIMKNELLALSGEERMMDSETRRSALDLCEEYLHQVWCMEQMRGEGGFALYGLDQHRMNIHERLCELLSIDYDKSKDILLFLDEKLGIDFSRMEPDSNLKGYAEKLLYLLEKEKENGTIVREEKEL